MYLAQDRDACLSLALGVKVRAGVGHQNVQRSARLAVLCCKCAAGDTILVVQCYRDCGREDLLLEGSPDARLRGQV